MASRFFSSINWHLLYPDSSRLLAPSGYGSYGSDSYALAALSSDRRLGVIYYTASQNVTVNLWTMAGPVQAQWFDPATGNYTTISGSPFANTGTRSSRPRVSMAKDRRIGFCSCNQTKRPLADHLTAERGARTAFGFFICNVVRI